MAQITSDERITEVTTNGDCAPLFEAIVAQAYILGIFSVQTSNDTLFEVTVNRQFVGVMHEGTAHETTWTDDAPGWLEDGAARKGETVSIAYFDDFTEALTYSTEQTKTLMTSIYGGLEASQLAP